MNTDSYLEGYRDGYNTGRARAYDEIIALIDSKQHPQDCQCHHCVLLQAMEQRNGVRRPTGLIPHSTPPKANLRSRDSTISP